MTKKQKINWTNTLFLTLTPLCALTLFIIHIYYEGFVLSSWLIAIVFYILTGMSITAGYHRLFAHRSYQAKAPVRFLYLLFGAGAFQNSCLKWAADHRIHHRHVDGEKDPYSIKKGFFFAHMGWIMLKDDSGMKYPKDLLNDPLVLWQHKYCLPISIFSGFVLPTLIGGLFGSWLGGFAIAALGRIVFVHHCTFFINSLCHYVGKQTYTDENSARDSFLMALFTYGEGYHNFHHKFQIDYRNGLRWYHFDPTKWTIYSLSWIGLTDKLKKVNDVEILRAKLSMDLKRLKDRGNLDLQLIQNIKSRTESAQLKWIELKKEYSRLKREKSQQARTKLRYIKAELEVTKIELKSQLQMWETYCRLAGV